MTEVKRKQRPKRGHVVRLSDYAWGVIQSRGGETTRETVDLLIDELHDLTFKLESIFKAPTYFILPESRVVCDSIEEARGEAILRAVRKGKKKATEEPIPVKVV